MRITLILLAMFTAFAASACGDDDDDGASEAQRHGVGAACSKNEDCTEAGQVCLPFKGGYCGVVDCNASTVCPAGSACVAHTDGKSYCFLLCAEKVECNLTRPVDIESNCSSNITFVGTDPKKKACVPPTG